MTSSGTPPATAGITSSRNSLEDGNAYPPFDDETLQRHKGDQAHHDDRDTPGGHAERDGDEDRDGVGDERDEAVDKQPAGGRSP